MPRLRQVSRAEASPLAARMYDRLFGPDRDPVDEPGTTTGTRGDWWTVFALVPDVLEHAVRGFQLYRSSNRKLDPQLRELGMARAGWAAGSQFVFSQHCKSCRGVGLPEEKIAALPHWPVADCFTEVERGVLAYTDALVYDRGRVSDEVVSTLRRHLSDEEVLELTYTTSLYLMHEVMARALAVEFDDRPDPVVEVPAPAGFDPMSIFAE